MFVPGNADGGEGMEGFVHSAYMMKQAAVAGQFAADPESGQALVKVFRERQMWLQTMMTEINQLGIEPPLGSSPAAQAYKPFFASLATDPDEGVLPALQKFDKVLTDVADAIEQSMKNYQDIDSGEAGSMGGIEV